MSTSTSGVGAHASETISPSPADATLASTRDVDGRCRRARPASRVRPSLASRTGATTSTPLRATGSSRPCANSATGPNSAARALRSGRFRSIGVIMFSLSSYGNMRTLDAIASEAGSCGLLAHAHPARVGDAVGCLGRLRPSGRARGRRRHDPDRAAPPRRGRDRSADRAARRRRRFERPLHLPRRRHGPGAGRNARDRASARPRARRPCGTSRARASRTRPSVAATRGRSALRERGAAVPEVLVGDWTAASGLRAGPRD